MQIQITRTEPIAQGETWVWFVSRYGEGRGLWRENDPPLAGKTYHVEIEVPGQFHWGQDIAPVEGQAWNLQIREDAAYLSVQVDSLSGDGCLAVHLAEDLILLETIGVPSFVSGFVTIRASRIDLYNTHL